MKKTKVSAEKAKYDKGQIFVKVVAGVLIALLLGGTAISLVYSLIF